MLSTSAVCPLSFVSQPTGQAVLVFQPLPLISDVGRVEKKITHIFTQPRGPKRNRKTAAQLPTGSLSKVLSFSEAAEVSRDWVHREPMGSEHWRGVFASRGSEVACGGLGREMGNFGGRA